MKGSAWLDLTRYTAIRYQHTHDTFVFDIRCKVCEKMIGRKVDANSLTELKKVVDNHRTTCDTEQSAIDTTTETAGDNSDGD